MPPPPPEHKNLQPGIWRVKERAVPLNLSSRPQFTARVALFSALTAGSPLRLTRIPPLSRAQPNCFIIAFESTNYRFHSRISSVSNRRRFSSQRGRFLRTFEEIRESRFSFLQQNLLFAAGWKIFSHNWSAFRSALVKLELEKVIRACSREVCRWRDNGMHPRIKKLLL